MSNENKATKNGGFDKFNTYKTQAVLLFRKGDYIRALALFSSALEEQPIERSCLIARSKCYLGLGNFTLALQDLQTVIDNDRKDIDAVYWKAEVLFRMSEFEDALICFNRGLRIRADHQECRSGVRKCEAALVGSMEDSGVELAVRGNMSIFYDNVSGSIQTETAAQKAQSKKNLLGNRMTDNETKASKKSNSVNRLLNSYLPPQPESDPRGEGESHATLTKAPSKNKQESEKIQRPSQRDKEASRMRAKVLGDLELDRRFIQNMLDQRDFMLPLNETFVPKNDHIYEECMSIMRFLDQRQRFWAQRNPSAIVNSSKKLNKIRSARSSESFAKSKNSAKISSIRKSSSNQVLNTK